MFLLTGRILATPLPAGAAMAVVPELMAYYAITAGEWGFGMRCGVAPVSSTLSNGDGNCRSRTRQ